MLEKETHEIGGLQFTFTPIDPFKAIVLDKKVLSLLVPVLGGLKNLTASGEGDEDLNLTDMIDFRLVADGLSEALSKMKDADFEAFAREMLRSVYVEIPGKGAGSCADAKGAQAFVGNITLMYEVMIQVMRYNKFTPFALAERGLGIDEIVSSIAPTSSTKRRGVALAPSES